MKTKIEQMENSVIDSSRILAEGQGLFFAETPDYLAAAECFKNVVTLKPNWAEGYQWLGSAYEKLGEEGKAAEEWQTAHTLDSNDSRPLISLGVLRSHQERFDEAIVLLERGIALKPHYGFADAKLFLAEAFEGAQKIELAKQQWREVLELDAMYPSYDDPMREAREKLQSYGG